MENETYIMVSKKGADLVEAGDLEGAMAEFRKLVNSDLADLDKSLMWCNIALIYEKMGMNLEVLPAYDKAIALERPHARWYAAERKAGHLHEIGKNQECLAIYMSIVNHPSQTEADKERINNNIAALRQIAK